MINSLISSLFQIPKLLKKIYKKIIAKKKMIMLKNKKELYIEKGGGGGDMHATCYCLLPYYSRVNKKYRTRGGGGGGKGEGGRDICCDTHTERHPKPESEWHLKSYLNSDILCIFTPHLGDVSQNYATHILCHV